jgi:hypothetical protein
MKLPKTLVIEHSLECHNCDAKIVVEARLSEFSTVYHKLDAAAQKRKWMPLTLGKVCIGMLCETCVAETLGTELSEDEFEEDDELEEMEAEDEPSEPKSSTAMKGRTLLDDALRAAQLAGRDITK